MTSARDSSLSGWLRRVLVSALLFFPGAGGGAGFAEESDGVGEIPPVERRLPPTDGIEMPAELRAELESRVEELRDRVWEVDFRPHAADAGALVKAVDLALRHNEFYHEREFSIASELLDLAAVRHRELDEAENLSWLEERGLLVRGYRSGIDDSYQPFGLEIPESLDLSRPVPLLVWLHGRGDKVTDLHFLQRCLDKSQAFGGMVADQANAIILHPFGRHCVGWKHAGEIDVFEAIEKVMKDYPVDPDRIALAGFSMGGAGAWHIGAHYRDRFCAVHAGAGFAETKEYNSLTPDRYPSAHVQTLWQLYDVPVYARNLLNGPVLAYSGEVDKQKQAADLMERELALLGHELNHVIGEGMEHRYHEESVAQIWAWLVDIWETGRNANPDVIHWQTPTLRYPGFDWFRLQGLKSHWDPATVRAERDGDGRRILLDLQGVSAFTLGAGTDPSGLAGVRLEFGYQSLAIADPGFPVAQVSVVKKDGAWTWGEPDPSRKRPGIQGPIDDAFMSRFLVVPPTEVPSHPIFARWVEFELDHFRSRWSALMRGALPEKAADELHANDIREANLVLWGDPESNPMIAEMADRLPVQWEEDHFVFRGEKFARDEHAPVLVFPNPLNPDRYVVLNSGLTFRENHDHTNSQQNPKLPDWAVIGLDELPNGSAPGRLVKVGFFDEAWE